VKESKYTAERIETFKKAMRRSWGAQTTSRQFNSLAGRRMREIEDRHDALVIGGMSKEQHHAVRRRKFESP
jgi:hypothetical protein